MSRLPNVLLKKGEVLQLTDPRFANLPEYAGDMPYWAWRMDYWGKNSPHNFQTYPFDGSAKHIEPADRMVPYNVDARRYFTIHGELCSMYRDLYVNHSWSGMVKAPFDCVILLLSGGHFAGAVYKNGVIKLKKTIERDNACPALCSKRVTEKQHMQNVKDVLNTWAPYIAECRHVFLRCDNQHEGVLFEDKNIHSIDSKYRNIPFVTGQPTMDEVIKVYNRMTSVIVHGNEAECYPEIEKNKGKLLSRFTQTTAEDELPPFVSPLKTVRRAEKQSWPSIDAGLKMRLHEAILENDYAALLEITSTGDRMEIQNYLSSVLDKLDGQNFMHVAAKEGWHETVAFLLDFDCDPSIKDENGRVPYEYCRTSEMEDVFKAYRHTNPDRYTWSRSLIPDKSECKENTLPVKKPVEEKRRNEVKERRKQRKDAKKICFD